MTNLKTTNKQYLKFAEENNLPDVLTLLDESLVGIDPFDKNINKETIDKIIKESKNNIWFYAREIIKVSMNDSQYKLISQVSNMSTYNQSRKTGTKILKQFTKKHLENRRKVKGKLRKAKRPSFVGMDEFAHFDKSESYLRNFGLTGPSKSYRNVLELHTPSVVTTIDTESLKGVTVRRTKTIKTKYIKGMTFSIKGQNFLCI